MLAVCYAPEVDEDLTEAARWYIEQRPDLGEDFISDFQIATRVISSLGQVHRVVIRDYRRVHLKVYPYAVYFTVHGSTAVIYFVIHTSRDPSAVKRLLGDRR
jgi:toxin ParE1/3/4